jgi:hypothetical protein
MSSFWIALIFAAGSGTWVFTKLQRSTGATNTKYAVAGASVFAIIGFIVIFSLIRLMPK